MQPYNRSYRRFCSIDILTQQHILHPVGNTTDIPFVFHQQMIPVIPLLFHNYLINAFQSCLAPIVLERPPRSLLFLGLMRIKTSPFR